MKAMTLNLFNHFYLLILAMQEWSEQRWKEVTSPSIQNLFAQAIKDMKEGKPLPELPPEIPSELPQQITIYRWLRYVWIGITILTYTIIIPSEPYFSWIDSWIEHAFGCFLWILLWWEATGITYILTMILFGWPRVGGKFLLPSQHIKSKFGRKVISILGSCMMAFRFEDTKVINESISKLNYTK